jgi:hypothetical protein
MGPSIVTNVPHRRRILILEEIEGKLRREMDLPVLSIQPFCKLKLLKKEGLLIFLKSK